MILGPTNRQRWAYAASKMVDEFLALAYWTEKRLPVVIVRLFNTVGPRQTGRYGMVIPRLVSQALRGAPLTVYGDGEQSRCFGLGAGRRRRPRPPDAVRGRDRRGRQRRQPRGDHDQRAREADHRGHGEQVARVTHIPYEQAFAEGFEDMRRRVPDIAKAKRLVGFDPKDEPPEDHRGRRRGSAGRGASATAWT